MPRGKGREHGRKPSVEVVEFTAPLVHAFLVKAASGDKSIIVPAVDFPAIAGDGGELSLGLDDIDRRDPIERLLGDRRFRGCRSRRPLGVPHQGTADRRARKPTADRCWSDPAKRRASPRSLRCTWR